MAIADPVTTLRRAALRVTKQRIAALEALRIHPHADVEQVARAVRADIGSISTQGIYDVLDALSEAGLVRRIEVGTRARFELRGGNHDHLVCRSCGALFDVPRENEPGPPAFTPAHGFRVDEAETTYWGRCPACLRSLPKG